MIPNITDRRWDKLIMNQHDYQFQLLAVKILMNRIYSSVKQDSSKANIEKCKQDVYDFFVKNEKISQKDLSHIFERS